jgi:hypothetical protein
MLWTWLVLVAVAMGWILVEVMVRDQVLTIRRHLPAIAFIVASIVSLFVVAPEDIMVWGLVMSTCAWLGAWLGNRVGDAMISLLARGRS